MKDICKDCNHLLKSGDRSICISPGLCIKEWQKLSIWERLKKIAKHYRKVD